MFEKPILRFLFIAGLCLAIPMSLLIAKWETSPIFQERVYEMGLILPFGPTRYMSAKQLRYYPARNSALALIAYMNLSDKHDEWGAKASEEALASLCLLSGQDFGTGFEGTFHNYGWGPPSPDTWPETLKLVNQWTAETFGADALDRLDEMVQNGELHIEINGQPYDPNE